MNTDTPETDAMEYFDAMCNPHRVVEADFARKLERERDEWKAKYIQQNKDLGCELRDPNGTIRDHAKTLQRERDEARGQLAGVEDKMRVELGGHPDSELWGEAGLIAATMRCVDALGEVTEQRDEAREALKTGGMLNIIDRAAHGRAAAIRERDEARGEMAAIKAMLLDPVEVELDMIRGNIAIPERPEFSGVYDTGKAMANLIRQRDEARGQRDRLAAALINCMPFISGEGCGEYSDAKEALQSLTPNETLSNQ